MNPTKNLTILLAALAATIAALAADETETVKPSENSVDASSESVPLVPPAWVVSSTGTVARAEAGDTDAMAEISQGYLAVAYSTHLELDDKQREAMRNEAQTWQRRRAKTMADREGDLKSVRKRAEAGDAAAQRNLGFRYSEGVDVEKDDTQAFEWTKKAAEQGDARAMLNLGHDYAYGWGVSADADEALAWYRKAVEGFRDLAINREELDILPLKLIGESLLDNGKPSPSPVRDSSLGVAFLEIVAAIGDVASMRMLGTLFSEGKMVERDIDRALFWLRRADDFGDSSALEMIPEIHFSEGERLCKELRDAAENGDEDTKARARRAEEWLGKSREVSRPAEEENRDLTPEELNKMSVFMQLAYAEAGYPFSQREAGNAYLNGDVIPKDMAKAVEWWKLAADQGEDGAMYNLGIAHLNGDGVAKDDYKAFQYWMQAFDSRNTLAENRLLSVPKTYRADAEKGDASAQFFMGTAYEYGHGVPKNAETAADWYRKAAEQGHPGAQTFLAYALYTGSGVAQDAEQAFAWFRKAAEQGNSEAQQNLGRSLFYGDGCEENRQEATVWYRKAAEQGEPGAMFNLALCYLNGEGVAKDEKEGLTWLEKAASKGHPKAAQILEQMETDEGANDVAEVGDAAASFDIPASLVHRMTAAHFRAVAKRLGTESLDARELMSLLNGFENAEEIASRPRGEMLFVDDLYTAEQRRELWPFDIETFEAQLEKQMVRDDEGLFCRVNADGTKNASNPTIRWVNGEIAAWAEKQLDGRFKRMTPEQFCKISGDETMPEGTSAWWIDERYAIILMEEEGAFNPRRYWIVLTDGTDLRFVAGVFDSFPNAKEATAALRIHSDAASANNLAVLAWSHRINPTAMNPHRIRSMLERAQRAGVPTARVNLSVLKAHIPEVFQEKDAQ